MMRLTQTSPRYLEPVLEQAFARVRDKCYRFLNPSYVIQRLSEGKAGLFRVHDDGEHLGWIVCEKCDEGGEPWLQVWLAEGSFYKRIEEVLPLIDEVTKHIGCETWRCGGRKGWAKVLKPIGMLYERKAA